METITWIINVLLIILSIQYVIGPILVWRSQKFPSKYIFNLLDNESFLSERSPTFMQLHNQIISEGFEYIGSSELIQVNSSMYFSIYNNNELKLACTLSSAHSSAINTTQIEFTQMYCNGSVLNVNNAPLFNIYPRTDKKLCFRFPEINEFSQLLKIASKLIKSKKLDEERTTFERGEEFATIENHLNDEVKYLVKKGWVSDQVNNKQRKLTIIGAILMTWKLCWPIKQILSRLDTAYSTKALENA